jgi:hypothetical protein
MIPITRWLTAVGLVLAGWLVAAQPAAAQATKRPVPLGGVKDSAGLFSEQAVSKARDEIQQIKRNTGKDFVVQTFPEAPERYVFEKNDKRQVKRESERWAQDEFDKNRVDGVYVLICRKPTILWVELGRNTQRQGEFTIAERDELAQLMLRKFTESSKAKDDPKKAQELRDQALLEAVAYVRQNMTRAPGAAAAPPANPGGRRAAPVHEEGMPGWVGWVCLAVVVLLVIWLIMGIIRAFSNRGAPGYGYGGGGGGYGGGGGGGGFFSSLLGGMFGAAAGMWMYNHFFGGGGSAASAAPPPAGGADNYQSDVGAGSTGTGGDWGADNDGGDAGGGGGDWGGGGDAGGGGGGGGDWGGGGGGGGGDWGGGGGGGGGDWGGGGGGGDWGGGGGGDFGGGGGGGDW